MIFRPYLYEPTACASYVFGCLSRSALAVVDPHVELVYAYVAEAERVRAPIVALLETHVQADHVSGLPTLVEAAGATAYLPAGAEVDFDHVLLADGETVELGNTTVREAIAVVAALTAASGIWVVATAWDDPHLSAGPMVDIGMRA